MKKPSETTRHKTPPTRSTRAPLALLAAATLSLALAAAAHAQMASTADRASERYQQRLAAAEKIKTDGVAKLTASYDAEVKLARDEVKRAFDPLIKAAAMRNQTEEVRTLTLKMESIINPDGVVLSPDSSAEPAGKDYKQLLGKWETVNDPNMGTSSSRIFEFKSSKTVALTSSYSTSGGGNYTSTEEWRATTKPDKIIIESKGEHHYSDRSYKTWYEIKLPFDVNSLEVTHYTEQTGGSSNTTYRLQRKK